MRWDDLFADLEAQIEAAERAQFDATVSELTRAERAGIDLAARLLSAKDEDLSLTLRGGGLVRGAVEDAAAQWLLLDSDGRQVLVPLAAVVAITGLPPRASTVTEVHRRLGIGHALRALARDRTRVVVDHGDGEVTGLIGVVGADYIEVSTAVGSATAIPIAAIVQVRSAL